MSGKNFLVVNIAVHRDRFPGKPPKIDWHLSANVQLTTVGKRIDGMIS